MTLPTNHIHVRCHFTSSLNAKDVATASQLLSRDESIRSSSFAFAHDRRDYVAAHALLRRTLSLCGSVAPQEWMFRVNAHGKPAVAAIDERHARLAFNIAHSRGLVVCAVGRDVDLGVDVEGIDVSFPWRAVAEEYFHGAEVFEIASCAEAEQPRRFVELWVLKEAFVKAMGTGLSIPLNTFRFSLSKTRGVDFTPRPGADPAWWQFALLAPAKHYRLAVAVRRPPGHEQTVSIIIEGGDDATGKCLNRSRTAVGYAARAT